MCRDAHDGHAELGTPGRDTLHTSPARIGTTLASLADAVQTVFVSAAPLAAIALLVVLRLPEVPLRRG